MEALLVSTAVVALAEIGDKTQIATAALAARFHDVFLVALGTTTGMMLADVPAVFLAERATTIIPLKYVRVGAALLFFHGLRDFLEEAVAELAGEAAPAKVRQIRPVKARNPAGG